MPDADETEGFECESCGAEVAEHDRYCAACGRELSPPEVTCSNCGGGLAVNDRYCRNCGTQSDQQDGFEDSDEESVEDSDEEVEDPVGDVGPRPIAARGLALRWLMMFVLGAGVVLLLSLITDRG